MKKLLCLLTLLVVLSGLIVSNLLVNRASDRNLVLGDHPRETAPVRLRKPSPARVAEFMRIMHQGARAN